MQTIESFEKNKTITTTTETISAKRFDSSSKKN